MRIRFVLAPRDISKIVALVVESITIPMVNAIARACAEDETVHRNVFSATVDSHSGACVALTLPFPDTPFYSGNEFHVVIVDDSPKALV